MSRLHSSFRRSSGHDLAFKAIFCVVAAGAVAGAGTYAYYQFGPSETVRVTVTDKERQVKSDGDGGVESKYIVFTDREVFQNTDSLLRWKWNSSDVQGALKEGCTYDFNAYGFRNNFLSMYRNIVTVKHVPTEACPAVARPGK